MRVRVADGPDGLKVTLVGSDGSPISDLGDGSASEQEVAGSLAEVMAHTALLVGCPPTSPSLSAIMAREFEASRDAILGVGAAESGANFFLRNQVRQLAAEIHSGIVDEAAQARALASSDQVKERERAALLTEIYRTQLPLGGPTLRPVSRISAPRVPVMWQPRRPYVHGQALRLDDSGFAVLGNSLLAAWFSRQHQPRPPGGNADRQEASERTELRDLLQRDGILDAAFTGPYGLSMDGPLETIADAERRLEAALNSPEMFAMLSIRDIDFASLHDLPQSLALELRAVASDEMRSPIAQLGPRPITRELRNLVLSYFRKVRTTPIGFDLPARKPGGPRSDPGAATVPAVKRDHKFISEGVEFVRSGVCRSANAAAKAVVKQYGFAPDEREAFNCGKTVAASEAAAVDRLQRGISKVLKGVKL